MIPNHPSGYHGSPYLLSALVISCITTYPSRASCFRWPRIFVILIIVSLFLHPRMHFFHVILYLFLGIALPLPFKSIAVEFDLRSVSPAYVALQETITDLHMYRTRKASVFGPGLDRTADTTRLALLVHEQIRQITPFLVDII